METEISCSTFQKIGKKSGLLQFILILELELLYLKTKIKDVTSARTTHQSLRIVVKQLFNEKLSNACEKILCGWYDTGFSLG